MASVIVVGKHGQRREVALEGDAVTVIGRDNTAGLALGDLQVSRRHALLVKAEQGFFVKDLGSRNGILLNKLRVPTRRQARLKNGDVLSVGRTTLVFKDLGLRLAATPDEPSSPTLVHIASGAIAAAAAGERIVAAADAGQVAPARPAGVDDEPEEELDEVEELGEDVASDVASAPGSSGVGSDAGPGPRHDAEVAPAARAPGAGAPGAGAPVAGAPVANGPGPLAGARPLAVPASAPATRSPEPPATRPAPRSTSSRGARADTDLARIPRALPAGASMPSPASPSAEVLVLRALERAERERVFYRNLVLVLLVVMLATLVGLLAWAIARTPGAQGEVPLASQGPAPAAPRLDGSDAPMPGEALDAALFARDVQPILGQRCASCHAAVGRGGALVLGQANDPQTVATNLSAVRRYVVVGRPEQSPLLLEPLPRSEGGGDHGGGPVLTMASPEWRALRDWVAGPAAPATLVTNASTGPTPGSPTPGSPTPADAAVPAGSTPGAASVENAPPTVGVAPVELAEVGRPVTLDASRSTDPEGDPLVFRWTLRARPDGSTAQLSRPGEALAQLVPDVAGRYVISVVVHDGRAPTSVEVTFVAGAAGPPVADRADAIERAATLFLGQPLPRAELDALVALHGQALVDALAARPELPRRWWQAELEHLGLVGDQAPRGEPWDSIPDRLRGGRVTAFDAVGALLVGQAWSARHSGRDAQVRALLLRVVGVDPESPAAQPEIAAAGRMFDGHTATFLGKEGASRADLVRICMADARTRRSILARACGRASNAPLVGAKLDEAHAALEARPADFFKLVAAYALQRVPQ